MAALCVTGPGVVGPATLLSSATALTEQPNVVLVLTDDQTMESVAKMPYVSSRPDWVRFPNAYIQNPLCCPSRATILTGRYDTHTKVTSNGATGAFDATNTLATWLDGAGYRTALVGKYLNNYPRVAPDGLKPPGWTTFQAVADGTGTYAQYNWDLVADGVQQHFGYGPENYQLDVLTTRANEFIGRSAAEEAPFFLYFAPTATHAPWRASPTREGTHATAAVANNAALFNEPDVSDKPAYIRDHAVQDAALMDTRRRKEWDAALSVDDAVAALDRQLVASGVAQNTVMIFMTDNGYALGEHRWYGKTCQYRVCTHTPLLVRYPGLSARIRRQMVSNVDIASTVADIAGVTPALAQDGHSLLPLMLSDGKPPWRNEVLHHWPGHRSRPITAPDYVPQYWAIRSHTHLYVELGTGERELYDLRSDPNELRNLAGQPAVAAQQAALADRLAALKAAALS
jgi:arylsulfatase A-like enzyme